MSEKPMFRLIAVYYAEPAPPDLSDLPDVAASTLSVRRDEQLSGSQVAPFRAVLEVRCRSREAMEAVQARLTGPLSPRTVLQTREHYVVDRGVTPEAVKGIFLFRRRSDLAVPAFQRYWLETHGPIAGRTPDIQRYVQCHVLPDCYDRETPVYDGVTELYWPDHETTVRSMASPSMTEEQAGDAPNFVAPGSVELVLTREVEV
jgi:uncharacterized protein (TIGR02118 family)